VGIDDEVFAVKFLSAVNFFSAVNSPRGNAIKLEELRQQKQTKMLRECVPVRVRAFKKELDS
jgi:hypothetical protein